MSDKKKSGVNLVEEGFLAEPTLSTVEAVEAESFTVSPEELVKEMKEADIEVPEKPAKEPTPVEETGVGLTEAGYVEEPTLSSIEKIEIESYKVSEAELEQNLKNAGVAVPEKPVKEPTPAEETGVGLTEAGYIEEPELSPIEEVEVESYVVSDPELKQDMKDAGVAVPEKAAKEPTSAAETGVGLTEAGYKEDPELSPIEEVEVESYVVSDPELKQDMKDAGIDVPEKSAKEKEQGPSGVDLMEEGFKADPELTPLEELDAIKYVASQEEIDEDLEKVEEDLMPDHLPLNDALLAKLQEAGYTGSLEDLLKLADDLKAK